MLFFMAAMEAAIISRAAAAVCCELTEISATQWKQQQEADMDIQPVLQWVDMQTQPPWEEVPPLSTATKGLWVRFQGRVREEMSDREGARAAEWTFSDLQRELGRLEDSRGHLRGTMEAMASEAGFDRRVHAGFATRKPKSEGGADIAREAQK
ncbi:hypothetical protein F2P79_021253 [Pimephales promelas]|nr:hypothetical protein F2P79_021253 [Pimephales promelas]